MKEKDKMQMKVSNITNKILLFIKEKYSFSKPFLLSQLYLQFPDLKQGTIREMVRRLLNDKKIFKIKNGLYALTNPDRMLQSNIINITDVIDRAYIKDNREQLIGYRSGINFANQLGLTTQTASVDVVCSNQVLSRKREIKINKNRIILQVPRVPVTTQNYKLLQLMDLLNDFEKISEYELNEVRFTLLSYIKAIQLSSKELNQIVEAYPLAAQVKFYKIGGNNVITQG